MTMKKENYTKPHCFVVQMGHDLMETLPMGGSQNYTDTGDDSGAGLAKKNFIDMDEDDKGWSDE